MTTTSRPAGLAGAGKATSAHAEGQGARQQITPEIVQWIAKQASAGHKPEAVLGALRICGWSEEAARSAVEETKRYLYSQRPMQPPKPITIPVINLSTQQPKPVAVPATELPTQQPQVAALPDTNLSTQQPKLIPGPDLSSSPWTVHTSDREVRVLATMQLPRLIVFGGLLSAEECDALIEDARERVRRSTTLNYQSGADQVSEVRTSDGMFFARGENELIQRIETRIAELVAWPVDHGEGLQILRYGVGAEYVPHWDYFDPAEPGSASILKRGGQRVASLVMYLHTPPKGGSTFFPDVGFHVAPAKGNAVFFSYDTPLPTTRTYHAGAPVIEGEKWIATKWLREGIFV